MQGRCIRGPGSYDTRGTQSKAQPVIRSMARNTPGHVDAGTGNRYIIRRLTPGPISLFDSAIDRCCAPGEPDASNDVKSHGRGTVGHGY
jgi:hypothetical protein